MSFVSTAVIAIAVDLVAKVAAVSNLSDRSVDLGVIDLNLVRNSGVAFGLGADSPPVVVLTITGAVILALIVAIWRDVVPAGIASGLIVGVQ